MDFEKEVQDIAVKLQIFAVEYEESLTLFEALSIAVKIQHNRIFARAFLVVPNESVPSALEAIAMELGAAKSGGTIKDAIYSLIDR